MEELIIQDVQLYELGTVGVARMDTATSEQYSDIDFVKKSFRLYGTKQQIKDYLEPLPVDEIWDYSEEKAGGYWDGIIFNNGKQTLKQYNQRVSDTYQTFHKWYLMNDKKIVVR